MGKTVIKFSLNSKDIDRAIKEIERYKQEFLKKENLLLERLAELGFHEASVRFATAMYDGVNDSDVTIEKTDKGYSILARGEAVAFIEFGTGVYHNTSEPYPNPRPEGIVGIGEYGQGKGKRSAWYYKGEPGTNGEMNAKGVVKTRGNPASMPLWYASEEMRNSILQIAREVFG